MNLRVRCQNCRASFLVPEERSGSVVSCPKCGVPRRVAVDRPSQPPVAHPPEAVEDEATSVFRPSAEAKERKSSRRRVILAIVLLLLASAASVVLALWPRIQTRPNDPAELVADAYLRALVDQDEAVQARLSVVEDPPAIRSYYDVERDRTRDDAHRGSFAPIAALHRRIEGEFSYDAVVGRFTPRRPLGPAAETLDALHDAKADAERSGLYDKIASGDPEDLFDAAEGLGQVFQKLAEGTLAPKRILPTYKMLVDDSKPPLPPEALTLARAVGETPKLWDALLKRPFFTLKADGPFIYERAEVDAQVVDSLGSPGDPPTPMRLSLIRFRLEGIDTSWRVIDARRILPGATDPDAPEDPREDFAPAPSDEPPSSLGDAPLP